MRDAVIRAERPELAEQAVAVGHEAAVRRFDKGEFIDPAEPARRHPEDDGSEVRTADLGRGEARPAGVVLPGKEPHTNAGPDPAAPAPTLLGGRARHRLDGKSLDLGAVAVAADAGKPGIDHEPDAGHGDRGLRHVRREHHPAPFAGAKDPFLLGVVEARVEGQHLEGAVRPQGAGRLADVALARQESEDVAGSLARDRPHRLRHGRDRIFGSGPLLGMANLDGVRPA